MIYALGFGSALPETPSEHDAAYDVIRVRLRLGLCVSEFDREAQKRLTALPNLSADELDATMQGMNRIFRFRGLALFTTLCMALIGLLLTVVVHPAIAVAPVLVVGVFVWHLIRCSRQARVLLAEHNHLFYSDKNLEFRFQDFLSNLTLVFPVLEARRARDAAPAVQVQTAAEDMQFF